MRKRVALVTGVLGGLGKAIAAELSKNGVRVIITDLPGEDLNKTSSDLGLVAIGADLGRESSVSSLMENLRLEVDSIDILVSAAGGVCGQTGKPITEVSEHDWREIFAANLDSVFFLTRHIGPMMAANGWGRIVTISSGAGLRPSLTGIQAYTAAKHGLIGLTKQLSSEFARYGVTVNSIAPGLVLSNPMTQRQWDGYGPKGQKNLLERIHTRRLGTPADIASAVAFLTSDSASWITGQVLAVDGGTS